MRKLLVFWGILIALIWFGWSSGDRALVDELAVATAETGVAYESVLVEGAEGIELHVVFAGPKDGPPVILIHGFPEFWYSWRKQIAALANAGYRVAAPDLRGYNRSDKPTGRDAYRLETYAADIIALMDGQGWAKANVAGHDVGAAVTWTLAYDHPERLNKVMVFNIAPFGALEEAYEAGAKSVSWYRAFFRTPFLPELALRSGGYHVLGKQLKEGSAPGAFSDQDVTIYKAAWARDNAISTMLGFYRADGLDGPAPRQGPDVPARLILASEEAFVPKEAEAPARRYLGDDNVTVWQGVSHWSLQEKPQETATAMIEWFGE